MVKVIDTNICENCGEEYWYEYDCATFEVSKLSACACDRLLNHAIEFLQTKGLYEEFMEYHKKREEEELEEWEE